MNFENYHLGARCTYKYKLLKLPISYSANNYFQQGHYMVNFCDTLFSLISCCFCILGFGVIMCFCFLSLLSLNSALLKRLSLSPIWAVQRLLNFIWYFFYWGYFNFFFFLVSFIFIKQRCRLCLIEYFPLGSGIGQKWFLLICHSFTLSIYLDLIWDGV